MAFLCEKRQVPFEATFSSPQSGSSQVRWYPGGDALRLEEEVATHFVLVASGCVCLRTKDSEWVLQRGMFASVPGRSEIVGDGSALLASHLNWLGMFLAGGPVEQHGRLRYIDGCSSTVLVAPLKVGDPTLNFLTVPPATNQTDHTHPSLRAGLVISGAGVCRVEEGDFALESNTIFCLPADKQHSFHTEDESLRIMVFHPDSDVGPSDDAHPMLSRTIVEGVPAHLLPHLQRAPDDRSDPGEAVDG